ncbi:hypothetical protein NPIL_491001 [Nephila pilipes]|uniref:Uncharacterized protein n=1 Tax=Nephila pilipes TaxID=299642 RepID=A0A8X6PHW5_NEPPI|nr:hypothetical protein NPIL_491001 [Nephila pilipes]
MKGIHHVKNSPWKGRVPVNTAYSRYRVSKCSGSVMMKLLGRYQLSCRPCSVGCYQGTTSLFDIPSVTRSSKLITTNRQSTESAKQASNSIKKLVTLEDSADSLASYFSTPAPNRRQIAANEYRLDTLEVLYYQG